MTQADFSREMAAVRIELDDLLRGASDSMLREPRIYGEWSCADVLAHFAGYTRGVADGLARARGSRANSPAYGAPPGLSDDDFNAVVVDYWRQRPISELLEEERDAFRALMTEVEDLEPATLTAAGVFQFLGFKSVESILPGNGYRHYREHMPALIEALRSS